MDEKEIENLDIPEELYAPMGNVTFEKPSNKKQIEPETLSDKNVKLEYAEKPFDKKKFITRIVILIVIMMTALAGYLYITNKKNVLRKAFSQTASKIETTLLEVRNNKLTRFSEEEPFRTSFLVSFDTTYDRYKVTTEEKEFLDTLANINLSETLQIDYSNKQMTHAFKSNYVSSSIIALRGNITENTINYKISEVVGKYINHPIEEMDVFYRNSEDEQKLLNALTKELSKRIFLGIKERDLKQNKTKLKIGNNEYEVKNTSLVLEEKEIKTFIKEMISEVKGDNSFKEDILKYFELDETKYQNIITNLETKIDKLNIKNFRLSVYSNGIENKVLGIKIDLDLGEIYTLTYLEDNETLNVTLESEKEVIFDLAKEFSDSTNEKINLQLLDTKFEITKITQNKNTLYEYTIKNQKEEYLTGTAILQDEETKRSKDGNIRLSIKKISKNNDEIFNIQTTLNYNVEVLEKIELYDDREKINYKSISDETKKEIKKKIEKLQYFSLVKEKIEAYINSKK